MHVSWVNGPYFRATNSLHLEMGQRWVKMGIAAGRYLVKGVVLHVYVLQYISPGFTLKPNILHPYPLNTKKNSIILLRIP